MSVPILMTHWVSVQFSRSVMSDSATPWTAAHQASLSITNSGVYSNSCPLSQWCHPTISSSVIPFFSCLQSFPASGWDAESNESALSIRWPKYWSFSFSISPSNEYSGLISSRMDWLDFLAVQGTLESLLQLHSIPDFSEAPGESPWGHRHKSREPRYSCQDPREILRVLQRV